MSTPPTFAAGPLGRGFWVALFGLYVVQYLGLGFFSVALIAILRSGGADLERLSLVYALGAVGVLKFLWAPAVDRYGWRRIGHYRSWLLGLQLLLAAAFVGLGWLDPVRQFPWAYGVCLVIAALGMTQDIAVDALACRMVPPEQRAFANALQTAGGMISFLIGGGLVLMAYSRIGWQGAMHVLALCNLIVLTFLLVLREPAWQQTTVRSRTLIARAWTFWRDAGGLRWIALMAVFPMAVSAAYVMITPLLVDAGWSLDRVGWTVNVLGSAAGAVGAMIAGWVMQRTSRRRALLLAGICQLPAVLGVGVIVAGYTGELAVVLGTALFFFFYTPTWVAFATMMMDRVNVRTAGTDYSLQWSVFTAFQMGMSAVALSVAQWLGYAGLLKAALALVAIAILIALWPSLTADDADAST